MQREQTVDIAKGLAIILMVIGHCQVNPTFRLWIFSFHMPLFFFFSGYFFTSKPCMSVLKSGFEKLVMPYIVTCFALIAFYALFGEEGSCQKQIVGTFLGNTGSTKALYPFENMWAGPIWFLFALFWTRLIYNQILIRYPKHELLISVILFLLFWQIGYRVINLPFSFGVGMTGLLFYSAGYNFRKLGGLAYLKNWHYVVGAIFWVITIVTGSYLNMSDYIYMKCPLTIITAVFATVIIFKVCTYVKGISARILTFCGIHSLDILIGHSLASLRFIVFKWFDIEPISPFEKSIGLVLYTVLFSGIVICFKSNSAKHLYQSSK